jgi:hypothetical protein
MGTRTDRAGKRGMRAPKRRVALLEVWLELLDKIEGPRRRRAAEFRRRRDNPIRRVPNRSSRPFGALRLEPDELSSLHERQPNLDVYEAVRGALAADDAIKKQGEETKFRIRETPDWKEHAAALEAEMLRRGMFFEVIDWSEDQASLPFEG